jgi:hypothetical protein
MNNNTTSPEKKRKKTASPEKKRKKTASPKPVTESRRLDADPRGGNGEESRGTPRPRRQRSLPRRRSFYGSGLWRGG